MIHFRPDTKTLHDARMEITGQAVRGLFLINGGGAVALLAFLQGIWKPIPELIPSVLWALTWLTAGLASAAPVNFVRTESSLAHQEDRMSAKAKWLRWGHRVLFGVSIICFVVAMATISVGAWLSVSGDGGGSS